MGISETQPGPTGGLAQRVRTCTIGLSRDFLLTPLRGQAVGGEAAGDGEELSQAPPPWLHTQTAGTCCSLGDCQKLMREVDQCQE